MGTPRTQMVLRAPKVLVLRAPAPKARGPAGAGRRRGWKAPTLVLLAFIGTWVGHTLECLRVEGTAGLARTMASPVHLYMLPLGVSLFALALVGGMSWLKSLTVLAGRLRQLRQAVRRGRRLTPNHLEPGSADHLCSLWLVLGLAQVALYLLQENIESLLAGLRAPGLGVALGQHWAAAPIQLLVACALAGLAIPLISRRVRLERAVGCHERLVARLWGRRLVLAASTPSEAPPLTPHQRWGAQRWPRPPPGVLAA